MKGYCLYKTCNNNELREATRTGHRQLIVDITRCHVIWRDITSHQLLPYLCRQEASLPSSQHHQLPPPPFPLLLLPPPCLPPPLPLPLLPHMSCLRDDRTPSSVLGSSYKENVAVFVNKFGLTKPAKTQHYITGNWIVVIENLGETQYLYLVIMDFALLEMVRRMLTKMHICGCARIVHGVIRTGLTCVHTDRRLCHHEVIRSV